MIPEKRKKMNLLISVSRAVESLFSNADHYSAAEPLLSFDGKTNEISIARPIALSGY